MVDIASVTVTVKKKKSVSAFNNIPNSFCLQGLRAMNAVPYWKQIPWYQVPVWRRPLLVMDFRNSSRVVVKPAQHIDPDL